MAAGHPGRPGGGGPWKGEGDRPKRERPGDSPGDFSAGAGGAGRNGKRSPRLPVGEPRVRTRRILGGPRRGAGISLEVG
jgi:hypothetical protein